MAVKLRSLRLCNFLVRCDYGLLMPWLSKFSPTWVRWPLRVRGFFNWVFDLEWRTLSLRHGYVRGATLMAMRHIAHLNGKGKPIRWTLGRYMTVSREEYDALRLGRVDLDQLAWTGKGLDQIVKANREGRGVVLLTAHFDSLYMGLMVLARQGLTVNLMSSKITEDERVPLPIRRFFSNKISAMGTQFSPGRVLHFEDGMKSLANALKRGEVLVIACDAPSVNPARSSTVNFLGHQFFMAPGPEFFARTTNSLVSAYCCAQSDAGVYEIECSQPLALEDDGLQKAFDCLEARIRAQPWRWWAADLYRTYQRADRLGCATTKVDAACI